MRIHNDFTLYWRVIPSGKRVVYFYAYDENNKRLNGRSTGEITMTAARLKCNRFFKAGTLIAVKGRVPTFAEYAVGFWDWDTCEYLAKHRKRVSLTKAYVDLSKGNLERKLLPFFGKMPLDKIHQNDIERFIDGLIKQEYQNNTIKAFLKPQFWKCNLRFIGKTDSLSGFSRAFFKTNRVLEKAQSTVISRLCGL